MDQQQLDLTINALEEAKKTTRSGGHYWMARDIQEILGYVTWESFSGVLNRARAACAQSGEAVENHFRDTTNMVTIGSGAERARGDAYLDRYACYLVAMNGDPLKPQVASAQTYFAVQTRRQELADADALLEHRSELRGRLTHAVKALNSAAKEAGVQNFALFADSGYRGLYEMGLSEIRQKKGLSETDEFFDRCGRAELAANEFRATQAEQKIVREKIVGQQAAMRTHKEVGAEVRRTMLKIGGIAPEDLPAEPSLKKLTAARKKQQKKLTKPSSSE